MKKENFLLKLIVVLITTLITTSAQISDSGSNCEIPDEFELIGVGGEGPTQTYTLPIPDCPRKDLRANEIYHGLSITNKIKTNSQDEQLGAVYVVSPINPSIEGTFKIKGVTSNGNIISNEGDTSDIAQRVIFLNVICPKNTNECTNYYRIYNEKSRVLIKADPGNPDGSKSFQITLIRDYAPPATTPISTTKSELECGNSILEANEECESYADCSTSVSTGICIKTAKAQCVCQPQETTAGGTIAIPFVRGIPASGLTALLLSEYAQVYPGPQATSQQKENKQNYIRLPEGLVMDLTSGGIYRESDSLNQDPQPLTQTQINNIIQNKPKSHFHTTGIEGFQPWAGSRMHEDFAKYILKIYLGYSDVEVFDTHEIENNNVFNDIKKAFEQGKTIIVAGYSDGGAKIYLNLAKVLSEYTPIGNQFNKNVKGIPFYVIHVDATLINSFDNYKNQNVIGVGNIYATEIARFAGGFSGKKIDHPLTKNYPIMAGHTDFPKFSIQDPAGGSDPLQFTIVITEIYHEIRNGNYLNNYISYMRQCNVPITQPTTQQTQCQIPLPSCGNGKIDQGEECDFKDGKVIYANPALTCQDFGRYTGLSEDSIQEELIYGFLDCIPQNELGGCYIDISNCITKDPCGSKTQCWTDFTVMNIPNNYQQGHDLVVIDKPELHQYTSAALQQNVGVDRGSVIERSNGKLLLCCFDSTEVCYRNRNSPNNPNNLLGCHPVNPPQIPQLTKPDTTECPEGMKLGSKPGSCMCDSSLKGYPGPFACPQNEKVQNDQKWCCSAQGLPFSYCGTFEDQCKRFSGPKANPFIYEV